MTILYIHTDKTIHIDTDEFRFLQNCAVGIRSVGDSYTLFAQKICLHEETMASVIEILYFAHDSNMSLYVTPSSHYKELYLNWE